MKKRSSFLIHCGLKFEGKGYPGNIQKEKHIPVDICISDSTLLSDNSTILKIYTIL